MSESVPDPHQWTASVFVVVCRDRHTDDQITVHITRKGADERIVAFMSDYPEHKWHDEEVSTEPWIRLAVTDDDGPSVHLQIVELEP